MKNTIKLLVKVAVGAYVCVAAAIVSQAADAGGKPNIIYLMADDQCTYSVGCYGNKDVETPNMDKLARDGLVFDRHYNTTSICMASRANVMTGMYEYNSAEKGSPGLGDCGAIYQIRLPDVNAGLGPGVWQSVDLEFQAAKFGNHGFMAERNAARVTVRLNGKVIHDNFRLSLRRNKYAAFPEEPLSPVVLQEHGSPVKFRNIWLVEKAGK